MFGVSPLHLILLGCLVASLVTTSDAGSALDAARRALNRAKDKEKDSKDKDKNSVAAATTDATESSGTLSSIMSNLPSTLVLLLLALPLLPFLVFGPLALAGASAGVNAINNVAPGLVQSMAPGAAGPLAAAAQAAAGGGGFFKKRSSSSASPVFTSALFGNVRNWLDMMTNLESAFHKYKITDQECQMRLTCEVHKNGVSSKIGSCADKVMQMFGIEGRLERSSFGSGTKSTLRNFLKAARQGLNQKDCQTIYYKCKYNSDKDKETILAS